MKSYHVFQIGNFASFLRRYLLNFYFLTKIVNAKEKMGDVVEILKILPRSALLILRNNNLLRSVNQELGVPVNRFLIMARQAVRQIQSTEKNPLRAIEHKIMFEARLGVFVFYYWAYDLFFALMIKLGKIKEVELDELIKSA
jgi:aarF domain-containing kinase